MHEGLRITVSGHSVDLLGIRDVGDGMREILLPVNFTVTTQSRNTEILEPTLALSPSSARSLMQALWDAGIRPETGNGSGEHVQALQKHIEFAEAVVSALLVKKP
jgi:hypothetical protein